VTNATLPSRSRTTAALAMTTPEVVIPIGLIQKQQRPPVVEYSDLTATVAATSRVLGPPTRGQSQDQTTFLTKC